MKNLKKNAGFTLVELIVVIAILGILAGVGTVAYTGYVEKANKAVDQQLVADIEYAMQLAYASDPAGFTGAASVVLSTDDLADVTGTADSEAVKWVQAAMDRAFGIGWENTLKLQYKNWGKGAETSKKVFKFFKSSTVTSDEGINSVVNGTAKPSFANDVDDLFFEIRDTAMWVSGDDSGAALIQSAAKLTAGDNATSSVNFAKNWASSAWSSDMLMGEGKGGDYNQEKIDAAKKDDSQKDFMASAVANAGVLKARNTALATYLRDDFPEVYDIFANYNYGSSSIPRDAAGVLMSTTNSTEKTELSNKITTALGNDNTKINALMTALGRYFGADTPDDLTKLTDAQIKETQAYKDGLAYYTMMSTVNTVNSDNSDDDTYWDEMQGAVSLYGSIARGEAKLDDLSTAFEDVRENQVAVAVVGGSDGLTITANPKTAQAGN